MELKEQIDKTRMPKHIAVIMDGNGRWAKQKGKNRLFGHHNGVKAVRETIEAAAEIGGARRLAPNLAMTIPRDRRRLLSGACRRFLDQKHQVTLRLSTHSAGGLTDADLELARRIDALPVPSA